MRVKQKKLGIKKMGLKNAGKNPSEKKSAKIIKCELL